MKREETIPSAQNFSVVICAYTQERWQVLMSAIESVKQQTLQPKEIIIVIDHSPELLQQVLESLKDVTVIENVRSRGLSGARNCGIEAATGEFIAFLDDDAVAAPDWLFLLQQQLSSSDVLGVGGAIEPSWEHGKPAWFPEEFYWVVGCTYRGLPEDIQPVRNLIGANMCLRREIFVAVGEFSSAIGRVGTRPVGCEETELCIRAHKYWPERVFLYQAAARVSHFVPRRRSSWHYFCSRCYAEGLSKAVVAKLAGASAGLSSERSYTLKTLPLAVLRGIRDGFLHLDISGFLRAGAVIAGLFITATGYLIGTACRPDIRVTITPVSKSREEVPAKV
ncbi:MAG: hypothetical protein NVS2B12_04520 [Ktedonobacteraceae bacterium]